MHDIKFGKVMTIVNGGANANTDFKKLKIAT
jgi:hypothetical protein